MSDTIYDLYHPCVTNTELVSFSAPLFVGLECEIESIKNHKDGCHPFKVTTDGSLRNKGYEFVSQPIPVMDAVPQFKELHATILITDPTKQFTDRTSIHVHANCANIPQLEVRNIVYMYALFEEFFFKLVDEHRRHNIHCVPLTETYLPVYYKSDLSTLISKWHKYTALNLKPLPELGTIEFRHMQGHNDPVLLDKWLRTINNLFECARQNPINKTTLCNTNIAQWFREIFGHTELAPLTPIVPEMAFNSITDLKLAVM